MDPVTAEQQDAAAGRLRHLADVWAEVFPGATDGVYVFGEGGPEFRLSDLCAVLNAAEALAAVTMQADHAIGLLIELTSTVPCDYDRGDCMTHGFDLSGGGKCPHDLARAFLAAARPRRTEATEEV